MSGSLGGWTAIGKEDVGRIVLPRQRVELDGALGGWVVARTAWRIEGDG